MQPRNNSARLGVPEEQEAPPAPNVSADADSLSSAEAKNSLLNFINPTEYVKIPSGGRFYPEGHPLYGCDSVEINMMTAKEEDILTNRSLLKKGVAIDKLVKSLLVNKSIDPRDLYIGDKNAIVISARTSAYGSEYAASVTCPQCGDVSEISYDLDQVIEDSESKEHQIPKDVTMNNRNNFVITLPKTGISAEVRLLNGHDNITKLTANKNVGLLQSFKTFVVSLNNVTDRKMINQFLESMPAADSKYLRETYAKITPNIDLTQDYECAACGFEQEMEVPLTADFFWPKS